MEALLVSVRRHYSGEWDAYRIIRMRIQGVGESFLNK